MSSSTSAKMERDKQLVDSLLALKDDRFEVWKYFEERANKLGDQLWSTGTWLMALIAATLSLPFVAGFVKVPDTLLETQINVKPPVVGIALFGMAICLYAYAAILDIRRHIEGNWRRAVYARTRHWEEASWGGRRRHGWNVLLAVGALAFAAFVALFLLALFD